MQDRNENQGMHQPPDATTMLPGAVRRHASIAIVLVLGVVLVGFVRGIKEPPPVRPMAEAPTAAETSVPDAVRYGELPTAGLKPNAGWQSHLSSLKSERPGLFDPVVRTEEMRQEAVRDRARNRAFDMAPPTIPHPIEQRSAASCLTCHGSGMKIGDRVATKVSHPHYANCTQCHVESSRPEFDAYATPVAENLFQGAQRSGPGTRAGPGAPPTIPHTTWMRQDCLSCHGLVTRPGTRTTHPWLSNCTQCHAPSAALDQHDFMGWTP